jgi:hypothetical protein
LQSLRTKSNYNRPHDFGVAEIARTELQKVVNKFNEDAKPTGWARMGFGGKSSKTKAGELLEKSVEGDFNDLKASVDNLEAKWKESHGPVSVNSNDVLHCSDNLDIGVRCFQEIVWYSR